MVYNDLERMDIISYILGLVQRICKVEAIDDCPFLLDFEVIVPKIPRYLFLHNCVVWIKEKECTIIVKVLYNEGHHDLDKFWAECIRSGYL